MKNMVLVREEGNKAGIWFDNIDEVELYDGELKLWIKKENERYCVYKCWVDKLKYYTVL